MKLISRLSILFSLIFAICAMILCCIVHGNQPEKLHLSPEQWHEDLQYLARTLPSQHASAFHYTPKEQFEAAVSDLDRRLDHLDGDAIRVEMTRIVALVGDAHTYLQVPQDEEIFPVRFGKFGDDYRVAAVAQGMEKSLGARLIKVQETPIKKAGEIIYKIFPQDENPPLADAFIASSLIIGGQLHGLGIIPDRSAVQYALIGDDGKEFTIQLHAQPPGQPGGDLVQASKQVSLSRQQPAKPFWCAYLEDSKSVYCNVRSIRDLKEPGNEMLKLIAQSKPDKLVIDLRQNTGGDYNEGLKYLVHPIRDLTTINKKGHLFVIIGPNTFSAAMSNATHFRYQTEAILVGRTIGEKPNSYQEPKSFSLPNSHLTVRYSTKFYKFVENGENIVRPDHEVISTWEDYVTGRDPALEWILKYASETSARK